jgi:hypothetical protein
MVLESGDPEGMVAFYERLGLEEVGREPGRVWLDAGSGSRIGIWTSGEKEHHDCEGPVVHDRGDRSLYLFDPEGNRVELWDIRHSEVSG